MSLYQKHKELLDRAILAIHERSFYTPFPEHHKAYGKTTDREGLESYTNQLGKPFDRLHQEATENWYGEEVSPYTEEQLGITYPIYSTEELLKNAQEALPSWKQKTIEERAGILIEAIIRLEKDYFETAFANMHTTGQSYGMSFQAAGPHSADRALEAVAMAVHELKRFPESVLWEKPLGSSSVKLTKQFKAIPKGLSLVIGCSTFPTWNSFPGIFASLLCGTAVIAKPHPKAVYPLALAIATLQTVLEEEGCNPSTIQLAIDRAEQPIAKELAMEPSVGIIDYTGSSSFGSFLETLPGKAVFTEKSGINPVIIDGAYDLREMMRNLAFSVSLYSGQMCTAPHVFFIPETGVETAQGEIIGYEEAVDLFQNEVAALALHPKMGAGTLGTIQNKATTERIDTEIKKADKIRLQSPNAKHPQFPNARLKAPTIIEIDAQNSEEYQKDIFGPFVRVVKTASTADSILRAKQLVERMGALSCGLYSMKEETIQEAITEMNAVFAPVTVNLKGFIWLNQNAAFSDFHGTGGTAAGNASFADPSFVNRRFVWVGNRRLNS
ncbi:aldehyde dehydrogenase family protein [Chitinophagales bacterium]|nr:aldehyde dehydrogenase family protein [Chitinophagales bacterium]